ncbi:MAG: PrsW family intramembrane metalloprotease [Roseiflexaceae bacterium]|nr:PrsW family intramembrane metalloprotease [Roseiflexaceae bacterium]
MIMLQAFLAAAIPTALYSLLIWWLDRYEKEPLHLIFAAFWWGAIPAIALAVLVEFVLAVPIEQGPLGPDSVRWGLAPLVEELLKALALAGLFVWARSEFDGPLDGIVYGALIGFGFSMTENALYFISFGDVGALFWVRAVLFGLNHAFFTSMVGLAIGAVRYQHGVGIKLLALLGGLSLAIVFHAAHNYLVLSFQGLGLVYSWIVQSTGILAVLLIAVLAWRHEMGWLRDELGDEVRGGIISAQDYSEIVSSAGKMRRQLRALAEGGLPHLLRVRHLHHLITELAFCKSKQRLADRYQDCDQIDHLRRQIVSLRDELANRAEAWA